MKIRELTNILLSRTRSDEYVFERDGTDSSCSLFPALDPFAEAAGRRAFLDKVAVVVWDGLLFLGAPSDRGFVFLLLPEVLPSPLRFF
jgi:hypothetical protein